MTKLRTLILLVVVAHWAVAMWHLVLAAKVLPAPNNSVSWWAVTLLTLLHGGVGVALWRIGERLVGLVSLIFFLAAMSADLYEHFLQPSLNNVFMVAPGDWAVWFNISVFILLALEVLGCCFGVGAMRRKTSDRSIGEPKTDIPRHGDRKLSSRQLKTILQG